MHDLNFNKRRGQSRNRLKKERKPINFRGFFRKAARVSCIMLLVALAGAASFEAYAIVSRTTFLRLERIEVLNLRRLTREEVVELAGVKQGDGMFALDLRRIGEQLQKNPWIAKAKVRRYFPHTLSIELAEREPLAVVNMSYLYYMDGNGDVFKPLTEGDSLNYPVVTGITEEDMGRDPEGCRGALKSAIGVIALLQSGTVLKMEDVSEIHLDKGYGVTLFTAQGGVPIKLGNDGFGEKLARLSRIYGELRAQMTALEYIDLNYGDKIIVKKA